MAWKRSVTKDVGYEVQEVEFIEKELGVAMVTPTARSVGLILFSQDNQNFRQALIGFGSAMKQAVTGQIVIHCQSRSTQTALSEFLS